MPPILLEMAGVSVESRYIGMYYQSTNPIWTDGRTLRTFSFYACWNPLIQHPAISFPLRMAINLDSTRQDSDDEYDEPGLGSDDCSPTHLIVCDRVEQTMAIAAWKSGHQFLKAQHPPRPPATPEEIEAERKAVLALMKTLDWKPTVEEMNQRGMFEMFSQPDAKLIHQRDEIIAFLDRHLDPEIRQWLRQCGAD